MINENDQRILDNGTINEVSKLYQSASEALTMDWDMSDADSANLVQGLIAIVKQARIQLSRCGLIAI